MCYLGVDVGSVSTDIVLLDNDLSFLDGIYLRTKGKPINAVQEGFKIFKEKYKDIDVKGAGTTGSGRQISSFIIGADVVKNEITAHDWIYPMSNSFNFNNRNLCYCRTCITWKFRHRLSCICVLVFAYSDIWK